MNNEIKEILQYVIDDIYQCGEYTNQAKKLEKVLDYITNLQQDNEKIGKLWREEEAHCILLQQENERLKENLQQEKDNLYLDNTMLKMENDIYKQGYEDFKELIEKTITEVNNE